MISNASSINKFNAVAAQLTYPFVIDYFELEASARFIVTVGGVLQNEGLGSDYTLTETPAVNGISPGGNLIFTSQPAVGEEIIIKRFTPRTQPNTFIGSVFPADSVEKTFDRNLMISQEIQDELTDAQVPAATPVNATNIIPDWASGVNYLANEAVMRFGSLFRIVSDHTSTTFAVDLDANKVERIKTQGQKGDTGAQGLTGPAGADSTVPGPAGINGIDGADGIFSQIATPAEVNTGTDNTKGMTPVRTKQAIDTHAENVPAIANNIVQTDQNVLDIQDLNSRLIAAENMLNSVFGIWKGQATINNGQAVPLDIPGLSRDGDGTRYAEVTTTIERRTDLEHRFSSFTLIMQFVDGAWYIKRDKTHVLVDALEVDGVTLSVNNLAGNVGQIQYVSDVMPGVDDPLESNIKFKGVELSEV